MGMTLERKILARLDELREIREQVEKSPYSRFETLRKIDENILLNCSILSALDREHESGTRLLQ